MEYYRGRYHSSYVAATATVAESAAKSPAVRKETKCEELSNHYNFFPIAIESYGLLSNKATSFLSDLGWRITISIHQTPGKQVFLFNESL